MLISGQDRKLLTFIWSPEPLYSENMSHMRHAEILVSQINGKDEIIEDEYPDLEDEDTDSDSLISPFKMPDSAIAPIREKYNESITLIVAVCFILVTVTLVVSMIIYCFCNPYSKKTFPWIDYQTNQQDSGPRNLPDLPDELEITGDERSPEDTMETEDQMPSEKPAQQENPPVELTTEEDSIYDFEGQRKEKKLHANDFYDYQLNVTDAEDIESDIN